jgi:transcriptional regulator with XRE-family HTH domain
MVTRIGPSNARPRRIFLREWRQYRRLTQQQLADRLDTTKGTISRIETGERDYTGGFLEVAADALQCEPADIISRDPTAPVPDRTIDDMLRNASDQLRRQVVAMVAALLDNAA